MATKKTPKKTAPKTKKASPKRAAKAPKTPPKPRTITCRLCKRPIEFTTGLDEMASHWEEEHAEALAKMRRKLDDSHRLPRE